MNHLPQYDEYKIGEVPPLEVNPFIDIEDGRPLSSIELEEYKTRPFLFMQIVSLLFVISSFITTYITLYFVIQIWEKIQTARFIQF